VQGKPPVTKATQLAYWSFGLAIAAVLFALLPIIGLLTIPLALAAAIIGHLAFKEYKREAGPHAGRWAAWTGTITGWVTAGLSLVAHLFLLAIVLLFAGAASSIH
jgi:uncharacterized protein involved in cysteine biosynthesis